MPSTTGHLGLATRAVRTPSSRTRLRTVILDPLAEIPLLLLKPDFASPLLSSAQLPPPAFSSAPSAPRSASAAQPATAACAPHSPAAAAPAAAGARPPTAPCLPAAASRNPVSGSIPQAGLGWSCRGEKHQKRSPPCILMPLARGVLLDFPVRFLSQPSQRHLST